MARKPDMISYREFNKLTEHPINIPDSIPSEVLFDDENINQLEETLLGMEFDLDDYDELEEETGETTEETPEKQRERQLEKELEEELAAELDEDLEVKIDEPYSPRI